MIAKSHQRSVIRVFNNKSEELKKLVDTSFPMGYSITDKYSEVIILQFAIIGDYYVVEYISKGDYY